MKRKEYFDKFENALMSLGDKMSRSKVFSSISSAMQVAMTAIIVGSFALLIPSIEIGKWQEIVYSIPYLADICWRLFDVTVGLVSLYVVFVLAYVYSGKIELKEQVGVAVFSLVVFYIITPFEDGTIPMTWIGTKGMIAAILIGILVPLAIKFLVSHNIVIKLPNSVPKFVQDSFILLVPAIIIFSVVCLLSLIVANTSYGDIHNMIFTLIQTPLKSIGLSLPGILLINILVSLVWWCGIHGDVAVNALGGLLSVAGLENLAATQAGTELPNIVTSTFFNSANPGGYGQLLIPAIIAVLFCKSKEIKVIGKSAIIPAIFTIGEPVLFGMPIMFNPFLLIPMLVTTSFNIIYWYVLISLGIVGRFAGYVIPWTCPPILMQLLGSSTPIRAAIAAAIMIVIDIFVWLPFMKAEDKQKLSIEQAATEEE